MKYWRIVADYRPRNKNKPIYMVKTPDETNKKDVKQWWNNTYSWLKIYEIEETTKEEYDKKVNNLDKNNT